MVLAQEVLVTLNLTGEVEIADVAVEVGVVARTLMKKSISNIMGSLFMEYIFTGLGFGFFSDETSFCGTIFVVFPDQLTKKALTPLS